jgi:RNA polymerase primary sigma factor
MNRKPVRDFERDDILRAYFEQIKETPLLTFAEELDLSRRVRSGDVEARDRMIRSNLRLVVRIAKAYVTPDVSLLDLIQEGNLGLLKAVAKYDFRKRVRFSTYASWWIKQSIVRSLSNKRRAIRIPHRKEEKLRKINKAYSTLVQTLMRTPTVTEVADEIKMNEQEVSAILNMTSVVVSLSNPVTEDSGRLQDMIEDHSYNPAQEFLAKSLREETMGILHTLREKERQILMYRFSFYGGRKYTLKHIGDKMGISPETVRQIEMRALRKLKESAQSLKEYVYS